MKRNACDGGSATTCAGIISFDPFYFNTLDTLPLSVLYRIAHSSQVPLHLRMETRPVPGSLWERQATPRSLDANLFAHLKEAAN